MQGKNRFAGAAFDDSDDEVTVNRTKTQKKKDEKKITEKPATAVNLANPRKMAEGGFEVNTGNAKGTNKFPRAERNERPQTARGGARGRGGRGRGDRGSERPFRPNTGRQVTTNEDGEQVNAARGGRDKKFRGKDGDRKSGMGRGTFKPGYNRDKPDGKTE